MLAYSMDGEPLSFGHSARCGCANENELGFKWIKGSESVAHYTESGGGYGGYNQDHECFSYPQSS
jgi:methionine sulfoxide reductase catalytic subunit